MHTIYLSIHLLKKRGHRAEKKGGNLILLANMDRKISLL